ncbi:MAG: hypothetical protein IJI34_11080 [Clostridia bacterium]|nr:hypothetical protein [Clostridia bacterium]
MNNKRMSTSPQRVYDAARYAILGLILITVLNIVLGLLDSDSYYVSSVFAAFFMSIVGEGAVGVILAALILAPFVIAFFLSKNKPIWILIALILTVLDLVFVIIIGIEYDVLLYRILDIIAHVFVIIILVLGVIYGKRIKAEEEAAAASEPAVGENPQRTAETADDDAFTDVVCSVAVSEDGQKHSLEMPGVARFYQNELALGTNNLGASLLLGSAFASTKERMRFAYADITRAYYAKKNERTVRLDLADGRYAYLILNNMTRDRLAELLLAHGVEIAPFED